VTSTPSPTPPSSTPSSTPEDAELGQDEFREDVVAGRESGASVVRGQGRAVAVVSMGGALGALARWALETAAPASPGGFPWTTFAINVAGALLMGVLVVVVTEVRQAHPLVRPFLGVGVLGGFTTFSSYAVEAQQLLAGRHLATAGLYLIATVLAVLAAVALAMAVTRRVGTGRFGGLS
jgi:CrcB protein